MNSRRHTDDAGDREWQLKHDTDDICRGGVEK